MKALLGKLLLDINEAKEEILIMLDDLQLFPKTLVRRLKRIEEHFNLPLDPNNSPSSSKEPITVDLSYMSRST